MAVTSSVSTHARRLRRTGFKNFVAMWGQWAKAFGAPAPGRSAKDFMLNARAIAQKGGIEIPGFAFGPFPNTGVDPMVDSPDVHKAFANWCGENNILLADWAGWFWHLAGPLGSESDAKLWLQEIRQHVQIMGIYLDAGVMLPGPAFRYDLIQGPGNVAEQIKLAAPRVREAAKIVAGAGGVLAQEPEFAHAAHRPFDVLDLHEEVGLPVTMHGIMYDIAHGHNLGFWGVKAPDDSQKFSDPTDLARLWGPRTVRLHFSGTAPGETQAGAHMATAIHAVPTEELCHPVCDVLTQFHATDIAVLDNCMMEFDEQDGCLVESLRIMSAAPNNYGVPKY